jgi:hypothetical protein
MDDGHPAGGAARARTGTDRAASAWSVVTGASESARRFCLVAGNGFVVVFKR